MTPEQLFERQQKEFEEKFVIKSNAGTDLLRYTDADLIKSFLSQCQAEWLSHRTNDAEKLIEGVGGMKKDKYAPIGYDDLHKSTEIDGFNQALSAVEEVIKTHYGIK